MHESSHRTRGHRLFSSSSWACVPHPPPLAFTDPIIDKPVRALDARCTVIIYLFSITFNSGWIDSKRRSLLTGSQNKYFVSLYTSIVRLTNDPEQSSNLKSQSWHSGLIIRLACKVIHSIESMSLLLYNFFHTFSGGKAHTIETTHSLISNPSRRWYSPESPC